jgi:hypothetical protein
LTVKTTLGVLVFVAIGGAVTAGAIALANTISTRQPPQAADLQLVAFPAPNVGTKADKLAVTLASFATHDVPQPVPAPGSQGEASPVSQYADLGPNSSAIDGKLPDAMVMKPAVADQPQAKPKAAAVKPAKPTNVVLNDAQIATLKQRLRLSPSQEQYWPEIEAALRGVVKQIYDANKKAHGAAVPVDTTTPEVERLKTAAMPFLMQMRADQKAEIIMLARIIGMEKMVAML